MTVLPLLLAQVAPDSGWGMMQFLFHYPWVIVASLGLLIPIVSIISVSIRKTRMAEIDAALKREMLDRGMTAEQIKVVLEASSSNKSKHKHGGCA